MTWVHPISLNSMTTTGDGSDHGIANTQMQPKTTAVCVAHENSSSASNGKIRNRPLTGISMPHMYTTRHAGNQRCHVPPPQAAITSSNPERLRQTRGSKYIQWAMLSRVTTSVALKGATWPLYSVTLDMWKTTSSTEEPP